MVKSAFIFLNGNPPRLKPTVDGSLLIGCDGGTQHILDFGLVPDVAIGDFDSFDPKKLPTQTKQIRFPSDKDKLDSELAICYAIEQGCQKITVLGFEGDRFDHMLGNTFLLTHPDFQSVDLRIVAGKQEIYAIHKQATIQGEVGDTISFFPLSETAHASNDGGLKYQLNDYELGQHANQGISNELTASTVEIQLMSGSILVVHQHDSLLY